MVLKDGTFKYLVTAKALNEGVDILNPNTGYNNELVQQTFYTHLQRTARGKTIHHLNPNKVTKIINVYIKDFSYEDKIISSRDANKLIIKTADTAVYWVDHISDIFPQSS